MISHLRRLKGNQSGSVMAIAAAAMPLMVGAAGLATDTIQWTLWKRQLQRAADSAAISGVYQRLQEDEEALVDAAALQDLDLNYSAGIAWKTNPDIDPLVDDPATPDVQNRVQVTLEIQKTLPFSSMFMSEAPVIRATATAAAVPGTDEVCVFGTDPSATAVGINIQGSTTVDLGTCSFMANSTNPNGAATNTGNGSTVIASSIAAAGGVNYSNNWTVDDYHPYSPQLTDPYEDLPIPAQSDCTVPNFTLPNGNNWVRNHGDNDPSNGADHGTDDIVCITGGMNIRGNLTLGPATYVINGGDLTMNATGRSITCSGCTIILTNYSNPANTGDVDLTGGTINITAPTEEGETYQGIAIYQDRLAADTGDNQINGNSASTIQGVLYTPGRQLLYNGGGSLTSGCIRLIGLRVTFSGNSEINSIDECTGAGFNALVGGVRIRLVA